MQRCFPSESGQDAASPPSSPSESFMVRDHTPLPCPWFSLHMRDPECLKHEICLRGFLSSALRDGGLPPPPPPLMAQHFVLARGPLPLRGGWPFMPVVVRLGVVLFIIAGFIFAFPAANGSALWRFLFPPWLFFFVFFGSHQPFSFKVFSEPTGLSRSISLLLVFFSSFPLGG